MSNIGVGSIDLLSLTRHQYFPDDTRAALGAQHAVQGFCFGVGGAHHAQPFFEQARRVLRFCPLRWRGVGVPSVFGVMTLHIDLYRYQISFGLLNALIALHDWLFNDTITFEVRFRRITSCKTIILI